MRRACCRCGRKSESLGLDRDERLDGSSPTRLLLFWRLGFLHLELGHCIHQDHHERMQKIFLRFKCAKKVVLAAIIQRWLMCKSGCVAALHVAPSGYHYGLPGHIAK